MENYKTKKRKARSGKRNQFYLGGTYYILIEMDDIDPAINDDEATLESSDEKYKKTIKVAEKSEKVDDKYLRLEFSGVIPGKQYSLEYDLNKDNDGNDLGRFIVFHELLIEEEDLDKKRPITKHQDISVDGALPYSESGFVSSEIDELYQEPDIDADDEAILQSEQADGYEE